MSLNSKQKDQLARTVRCPRCNAQPYFSCSNAAVKVTYLKRCHAERVEAAVSASEGEATDV